MTSLVQRPPEVEALKERPVRRPVPRRRRPEWMHVPLFLCALVTFFPFWAMVALALQPGQSIRMPGSLLPRDVSFAALHDALSSERVLGWALNSAVYSLVSVVLVLLFASMAGYAFAKKRFMGRELVFWVFVAMLMVPGHLTLIPQFVLVSEMGGLDSMWGLIVPTIANAQAMFLMRQFIQDIPDELIEAARIDGAGEFRVYWSIILPQTKPIMATLGTFVFLWHWNDFLWPLVSQRSPDNYVLTVGLNSLQTQDTPLATTMAAAVVTFIPTVIVFICLQRFFVRGVMMSGLK
ncbi:multiple sugar transport system permease protein [Streptomyces sp. V4I23]|uniref:carbohydrate ABC transporter permease n=1 Tax=Streptomyces sp. V4I23 TaxID=3042282 RepID=UPI0027864AE3|nr:carbohydrate ABC transporter permease [Streptomyces sp. V4I23]MDQ1007069.1 multiple sugar transport system permease protein [Streptomyces sp. V4I23]